MRRYVNTTENAYILIEYSYAGLLCHHDKPEPSLLQVYTFFFCGRIRPLKSFHQTSDVFLAVLKLGGSLVTMTNDDKQQQYTAKYNDNEQRKLVTIFAICQLIYVISRIYVLHHA